MRTQTKRRGIAALVSTAVVAAVFGVSSPASAATTPALCLGRDTATQSLLDTLATVFAPPGSPPPTLPASLEVGVDVTVNAPQSVDVGATGVPVSFDVAVALPESLIQQVAGLGVTSVEVNNQVTTMALTNADPATIASPSSSQTIAIPASGGLTVPSSPFGDSIDATGPDQSKIDYRLDNIVFDVKTPPIAGLFPAGLNLNLICNSTSTDPVASTDILQPGPPIAPDVNTQVALGGTRTVTLPVSGNPPVDNVTIETNGTLGTASVAKVGNVWRLTYVHDQANGDGTDTVVYKATNAFGGGSSTNGTVSIEVLGNQCEANPSCSLDQIIEFDVEGTTLSMEQTGADVTLDTVTLDGTPQSTTGEINNVTVIDARGDGSGWDLVGSVTDFKTDAAVSNCPRGDSSTWDYRCIPANNLGWSPAAEVAHEVIPGDVAAVDAGATSDADDIAAGVAGSGLETDQALCTTEPTTNGGTFVCGAGLALLVPASASAGTYSATLTLTLS
jgi:hypothetical protein